MECGRRLSFLDDDQGSTNCDLSDSDDRCCSSTESRCNNKDCLCHGCVDKQIAEKINSSSNNCDIAEVNGFLKTVCFDDENSAMSFKCAQPESNLSYGIRLVDERLVDKRLEFTEKCNDDPKFYQACGFVSLVNTSDSASICGWHVCNSEEDSLPVITAKNYPCNGSAEFSNTICDGKCDTDACEDESICNGIFYGMECINKTSGAPEYLPVELICDGHFDCKGDFDENICNITDYSTTQSCLHKKTNKSIPIHDNLVYEDVYLGETEKVANTRCAILNPDGDNVVNPYCANFLDQTNCTDPGRVGGYCRVNGSPSNISNSMVCNGNKICDDGSENFCENISLYCPKIHKHRLCDGELEESCSDGGDESHDDCKSMTKQQNFTCIRKFGIIGRNATIPLKWIMDDELDCIDGLDEDESLWTICNVSDYTYTNDTCKDAFLCPDAEKFVGFDVLCDSKESCNGTENEVCTISRDIPKKNTTVSDRTGLAINLCDKDTSACWVKDFPFPKYDIFGLTRMKLKVNVSNASVDCNTKFGEYYVYLSCMGLCENSSCPLENMAPLRHNSCPGQYSDRIITLANNTNLTFVTKSEDRYHNDYFHCDNGRCVNFSQVCDLVNDCEDFSDEWNCTNHFTCAGSRQLIHRTHKCDGIYDCLDLSDECNEDCKRRIIKVSSLTPFCWVIGTLAALLNICALTIVPGALRRCRNENILFSKVLVMLIFMGDLMMGIYLVALAVYDDIIHKEDFCKRQVEWFTGVECSALGIISTIGSQLSLFSMAVLSMFRLWKVLMSALPLPVSGLAVVRSVLCATVVIIFSVAIAMIPLIPSPLVEDYFVQGMYYDPAYKVFVGFNSKQKHINTLKKYYVNSSSSTNLTKDTTWKDIGDLVDGMFSHDHGNLNRSKVHFYGNDGICMFKYIIPTNDARRGRQEETEIDLDNDPVVWAILTINLICFVLILISAIAIFYKTRRSSALVGHTKNKAMRKRSRSLEKRILAIVVTDFFCWVPFIIICYLHNQNDTTKVDASEWYQSLTLVVLPINSLINPLIYDRSITQFCKLKVGNLITSFGRSPTGVPDNIIVNQSISPELKDERTNIQMKSVTRSLKSDTLSDL